MTIRTFTLKDFFDRDQAEAKMRAEQRRPFGSGDLAGAGMTFVPLPEVGGGGGGTPPNDGSRAVHSEINQTEEQLRLAREWASRPPSSRT